MEGQAMLDSIKSVIVGLTEEGRDERSAALPYGLTLARAAGAHLTVQAASLRLILTQPLVSDFAAELVTAENQRLRGLADAVAERTRHEAAFAGVNCVVESPHLTYGDLVDGFVAETRVHDLSILDAEEETASVDRGLIEAVLFGSGRPVIVVPPGREGFSARRVAVAWDGSARAARAVADAMPLLRQADTVEIISVVGEKDLSNSVPGAELAPHLVRHGIEATVVNLPAVDGDVAETLRRRAAEGRAELIVSGAYKHSRLREWILGGVTQSLLKRCPVPLFLAH
jgi:nucleotide-binding universal stress UspA family protein